MLRRILLTLSALLGLWSGARAATGDYITSLPYSAANLLSDPLQHRIYASAPGSNAIWVFDSDTLTRIGGRPVFNQPGLMAMSPDGSEVYYVTTVAGVDYINVADAMYLSPMGSYASPHPISNLVVGSGDRVYATYDYGIMRFNSGGYLGELDTGWPDYPGGIVASADGNQLFVAVGQPYYKALRQFDLSGAAPVITQYGSYNDFGSTWAAKIKLALSPDSQTLALSTGGSFEIISTEDFWDTRQRYAGLNSGAPSAGLFSGDGQWFYTTSGNELSIFNAATGALDQSLYFGWDITAFALSGNGDRMYVGVNNEIRVLDTGRVNQAVPEPSAALSSLLGAGMLGGMGRRRRGL